MDFLKKKERMLLIRLYVATVFWVYSFLVKVGKLMPFLYAANAMNATKHAASAKIAPIGYSGVTNGATITVEYTMSPLPAE